MARLDETFRIADLPEQPQRTYGPVPEGVYEVTINGAELKNTKSGTGKYLAIRYDVVNGDHKGRVLWGNMTMRNQNLDAERIGRLQFGELLQAIGKSEVEDTDELIGASLKVKVVIKDSEQYGPSNEVKGWRPISNAAPTEAAPKAAASGKAAPPWAKK